jgi:serine/threonine protein kinase
MRNFGYTGGYKAPEVHPDNPSGFNVSADWYAFGCTMYSEASGRFPDDLSDVRGISPASLLELIASLTKASPSERLCGEEGGGRRVLSHPYFKEVINLLISTEYDIYMIYCMWIVLRFHR